MLEKKAQKLDILKLTNGQVVWSEYFKAYVVYAGRDFDEDFCFKYLYKEGYCIIYSSDILEPPSLIKELL